MTFHRVALFVALVAVVAGLVVGFAPKTVRYRYAVCPAEPQTGGSLFSGDPRCYGETGFADCGSGFGRTSPSRRVAQSACARQANLDTRAAAGAGLIVVGVLLAGGVAIFRPTPKPERNTS